MADVPPKLIHVGFIAGNLGDSSDEVGRVSARTAVPV
jgi:hypothetical protein